MTDTIIKIATADDIWAEENPRPSPAVLMATNGPDNAYLSHSSADWSVVTHTVVGEWDEVTGEPLQAITSDYETWIRPLGNDEREATGLLDSMRWQGHPEAKWFEFEQPDPEQPPTVTERYPEGNRPFSLLIERQLIEDDGFPHIPHGWKVIMISDDPERDITARGIGIYDSDWNYLYTTGAFVPDGLTYSTVCPVGQRTADEQQINFKLLLGSAPEGAWTLPIGQETDTRQFWKGDQGDVPTLVVDLDGDGSPDTEILYPGSHTPNAPRITVDEDSVNIDIDGDGVADIIISKPQKK